jgi:hypothetical protein
MITRLTVSATLSVRIQGTIADQEQPHLNLNADDIDRVFASYQDLPVFPLDHPCLKSDQLNGRMEQGDLEVIERCERLYRVFGETNEG